MRGVVTTAKIHAGLSGSSGIGIVINVTAMPLMCHAWDARAFRRRMTERLVFGKTRAPRHIRSDHSFNLWDIKTVDSKISLYGHGYRVWALDFGPQGSTLATPSDYLMFSRGTTRASPSPFKSNS